MWKTVLTAVLSLCVGVTSALAQSNQYPPMVRNDTRAPWQFGVLCPLGASSVTTLMVVEPNRTVSIDPRYAQQGCTLFGGGPKAGGGFNSGNMPGSWTVNSLCGVNTAGAAYCTNAIVVLNLQVARADKPVTVLVDGNPFSPGPIASAIALNKQLLAGPHTLTVIGTGKGSFDISVLWPLPNGSMAANPLIRGASPTAVAGETWMVSRVIQLDAVMR